MIGTPRDPWSAKPADAPPEGYRRRPVDEVDGLLPPLPSPVDLVETDVESAFAAAVPALPAPRFCTACGAGWNPEWLTCGACAPRTPGVAAAAAATQAVAPGGSRPSISAAVSLYFCLLATSLIGIAVILVDRAHDVVVNVEIGMLVIDTAMVAGWAIACGPQVLPLLRQVGAGRWYAAAVGLPPVTFTVAALVIFAAGRLMGVQQLRYAQPFLDAGYGWGAIVIAVCVQPAVVEELAFRGVILGALRRWLTDREALAVSTMMFALLHLSVPSTPHLILIGAALGWLRLRSGSLYPGMVMHGLHNGLCLAAEAFDFTG